MNKKFLTRGLVGLAAAAALVIVPTLSANAAIVPTTGSTQQVHLLDADTLDPLGAGTALGWNRDVFASPTTSGDDSFAVPSDATSVRTFIAPRGKESDLSQWNAYGPLGLTPSGISQPNLKPSGNTSAGANSVSGTNAVGMAGGDYSLGIAFMKDGGLQIVQTSFTFITVTANSNPNLATWTFDVPAAPATAPAITTQPTDVSVLPGQTATFTAAASGTTPTVKWQSSTDGTTFADIAGATSTSYTTPATALTDSGKKFRAVFTNSAGTATSNAAALTVVNTVPTQPSGSDAGKVTIADPAQGATSVVIAAGASHAGQVLQAWGWSDPTNLGTVTLDASGNASVNIAGLAAGATHTIALTLPGSAAVIAWGTVNIPAPAYPDKTVTLPVTANVKASDLWSLNAAYTAINFNDVSRGQSVTRPLGKVTVVDDRNVLKGWTLSSAWGKFTNGAAEIPASAMTLSPKQFDPATPLVTGISLGTAPVLAQSTAGVSTGTAGALFDGDLTFTAPQNAVVGTYNSTLTLTLTSK